VIFSRENGSVTPLRLATISRTVSWVVKRFPHSAHDRRRRIAAPSSVERLSITLLSGLRQNGQCMAPHPSPRARHYTPITQTSLRHHNLW
jgi:hypothetical protein